MSNIEVKQLLHLGVVMGIIKDLKIIEMIDERIPADKRENVSAGESVAAMILNGLGFSDRVLSMTPYFFENKALNHLFGKENIKADYFNRFKLGRTLDDIHRYGCDRLFYELSFQACIQERVNTSYTCLDTTSFSLEGEYIEEEVEVSEPIKVKHGYSKDHRPDLKQLIQDLIVAQDGGVPLMTRTWGGNETDIKIFQARAKELINEFKKSENKGYLIADSKLYNESNCKSLERIEFITRIPSSIKEEKKIIEQAWASNQWSELNKEVSFQEFEVTHYGIRQRWIVAFSQASEARADNSTEKAIQREAGLIEKEGKHFIKKKYCCVADAKTALECFSKSLNYHKLENIEYKESRRFHQKGRPKKEESGLIEWEVHFEFIEDEEKVKNRKKQQQCYVLGTNISNLTAKEVIEAYKGMSSVELGFRFLKDPVFFASSLYLKKPTRLCSLLMVMTLALLVYSIGQRRMRQHLKDEDKTLPNQIRQPIKNPTLRWLFYLLDGIYVLVFRENDIIKTEIQGITDLKEKILRCFGNTTSALYGIK